MYVDVNLPVFSTMRRFRP